MAVTDILDRIDEALDGHNDDVFADAMASVRDLLDGADDAGYVAATRRHVLPADELDPVVAIPILANATERFAAAWIEKAPPMAKALARMQASILKSANSPR